MKDRIGRMWSYFRRGHSTYLAMALSFANFVVIQYRLLIQYVPFLSYIFSSLLSFGLVFTLIYIPISTLIGWLDYKRFAVPIDLILLTKANPYYRDIARALYMMTDKDEVKEVLKRWI